MLEIRTKEEFTALLEQEERVLVDFWAPWCKPCETMKPEVEALSEELKGSVVVASVNTDELKALAQECKVMTIPTLVLFKSGKEVDRVGGNKKAVVVKKLLKL